MLSLWKRLTKWHQTWSEGPITYSLDNQAAHHCLNCNHDYVGNYCPCCGQNANIGRFTWKGLVNSIFELWDLNSRSALSTLCQLFYRPGHLISDYIDGRRARYFPPIKLLVITGLFALMSNYLFFPNNTAEVNVEFSNELNNELEGANITAQQNIILQDLATAVRAVGKWSNENQGWSMLLICSFFILPTRFFFRHAPRHGQHNIPEGFIIQAYLCSPMLVFTFPNSEHDYISSLSLLVLYLAYYQLFGYGKWATLWRTTAVFFTSLALIILTICLLTIGFILFEFA